MKMSYAGKLSWIFGITWGLAAIDRYMVGFAAPGYMAELKLNFTQLGIIIAMTGIGTAVGAWIINPITEYYGRRVGSVWANLGMEIVSGLTGLVRGFGQLVGVRFLMGFGMGSMYGPGFAAIAEEAPPEKRGLYMGFAQSMNPLIGLGIGVLAAGYLMETVGWRYGFFLIAIPGVIFCLILASFQKEPASVAANIRRRKETGKRELHHEGKQVHLWDVFKYLNISLSSVLAILTMAYLFVLFSFVPSLFADVHKFGPIKTGWVMTGGGFVAALAQIVAPHWSDKIGRKPMLVLLYGLGTIGGILFALSAPGTHPALLAIYFAMFCIGLSAFPLYLVIIPTETVPFTLSATAVAVPQGLGELLGATVFPAIGGRIADVYGLPATMWLVVVCSALACATCFFLKETAPAVVERKAAQAGMRTELST